MRKFSSFADDRPKPAFPARSHQNTSSHSIGTMIKSRVTCFGWRFETNSFYIYFSSNAINSPWNIDLYTLSDHGRNDQLNRHHVTAARSCDLWVTRCRSRGYAYCCASINEQCCSFGLKGNINGVSLKPKAKHFTALFNLCCSALVWYSFQPRYFSIGPNITNTKYTLKHTTIETLHFVGVLLTGTDKRTTS